MRTSFLGIVPFVVALALAGCGTGTAKDAEDKDAPKPVQSLGSSIKVEGKASSWSSSADNFDGTVTVLSPPSVFVKSTGQLVLVFDVEARATKGVIPTGSWVVQTENAVPVHNQPISEKGIATPPLGPKVADFAKGFITFEVPDKSKPTVLELMDVAPGTMGGSGEPIARWSIGELPKS